MRRAVRWGGSGVRMPISARISTYLISYGESTRMQPLLELLRAHRLRTKQQAQLLQRLRVVREPIQSRTIRLVAADACAARAAADTP